ncbi:glycoside hydrolase family 75 protein [Streptomyces sp. NPDC059452]|uniref:glycoside hydrolase family 75 protein n=1 Tax=Streptomyces sp. NPDC059452 TaxID=3346835 RepID=UPI0036823924
MRTRTLALTAATSATCAAALLGPAALPATATVPVPDTWPESRVSHPLVHRATGPVDRPGADSGADPEAAPSADPAADPEADPTEASVADAGEAPAAGPADGLVADAAPDTTPDAGPGTTPDVVDGPVSAAELLAEVRSCRRISQGKYRTDANSSKATVPVCATSDAVFWKADMDIDCDGRRTKACNEKTDPYFQPQTAFQTSRGKPLDSAALPYVVVPAPGRIWDYRKSGLTGGSVVAVVYENQVRYAVIGDTGPAGIIGEGSYALAEELGIDPHPTTGGAPSGVTYIAFKDSRISPLESRAKAESRGEELARAFVGR